MVIFNCDLWLKDASYGKKSKHKKSLELYFQQLLFHDVCSKTPPFATNFRNAILKTFLGHIQKPQMTVENDQFRAFFRLVPR